MRGGDSLALWKEVSLGLRVVGLFREEGRRKGTKCVTSKN